MENVPRGRQPSPSQAELTVLGVLSVKASLYVHG